MQDRGRERGSVTAEFAVVLPAVVLVAVLCLWAVTAAAVHLRCLDAARTGARALARGESAAAVLGSAGQASPPGASVRVVDLGAGLVGVQVRARVPLPGPWSRRGPGVTVGGRAVAAAEPGTDAGAEQLAPSGGRGP